MDRAGRTQDRGRSPDRRISLCGSELGHRRHICAFFKDRDEEYRALLPFITDGLDNGEKAVHTIDPARRRDHLSRLETAGLDVETTQDSGQLELRDWTDTHLRGGRFDQDQTLGLFGQIVQASQAQGFPLIRFVTHMEWALESLPGVDNLLEYEAKANDIWLRHEGPVNPVVCVYDLNRFGGDVVVDIMRTHPMIIIGGVLQENPFFVSPDEFLRELQQKSTSGPG